MAILKLHDLTYNDLQNARNFVKAIVNMDNDWQEGDSLGNTDPAIFNNYAKNDKLLGILSMIDNTFLAPGEVPPENISSFSVPGWSSNSGYAGYADLLSGAPTAYNLNNIAGKNYNYTPDIYSTSPEMALWLGGFINWSQDTWENQSVFYSALSEAHNTIRENGVLTLFAKVAYELYVQFDSAESSGNDYSQFDNFNVLKEVLTEEVYEDFLKVDAYKYLKKEPQGDLTTSTLVNVPLDIFPGSPGLGSPTEQRAITYLDFLAFVQKYPQVFALGNDRAKINEKLKSGGTTLAEDAEAQLENDPRLIDFLFLSSLPAFDETLEPETKFSGATHYVRKLTVGDEEAVALLRSGYAPSDRAGNLSSVDIKVGGDYKVDQSLFDGSIIEELSPGTQVQIIKAGLGKRGVFNSVEIIDEAGNRSEGYLDSRVLRGFPLSPASEEDILVQWLCNLIKQGSMPVTEVPEPDEAYVAPDWRERDECQPFLNKKENEWWITVEVPKFSEGFLQALSSASKNPEMDIDPNNLITENLTSVEDTECYDECVTQETARILNEGSTIDAAHTAATNICADKCTEDDFEDETKEGDRESDFLNGARQGAARKGLKALLKYLGKVSSSEVVDKIVIFNTKSKGGIIDDSSMSDGLFFKAKKYHSENRQDNKIKVLVQVSQSYLEARWLTQVPIEYNTLSVQQYADAAKDGIIPEIDVETDKIEKKIETLLQDLEVEFKTRIRRYSASGGNVDSFPDINKKKNRLENFVQFVKDFLKLNDIEYDNTKNNILKFGLTKELKVLYAAYSEDPAAAPSDVDSDGFETVSPPRTFHYLGAAIDCVETIPDEETSVFADQTATGYLFYAKKLDLVLRSNIDVLEKEYAGIKLVQKFTIPSPAIKPAKEKESPGGDSPSGAYEAYEKAAGNEKEKEEKKVKTKEDLTKENEDMESETDQKKAKVKDKENNDGDDFIKGMMLILPYIDDVDDLFDIVYRLNIREFIIQATMCLRKLVPIEDAIEAATMAILKALSDTVLMAMAANEKVNEELSKILDPDTLEQLQMIAETAKPPVTKEKLAFATVALMKLIKEKNLVQDFFNAIKNATEFYKSDEFANMLEAGAEEIPGLKEIISISGKFDNVPGITALKSKMTADATGVFTKEMDVPSVEVPTVDYSDDPLGAVDMAIEKGIDEGLNSVLLSTIKTILQEALMMCAEGNVSDIPSNTQDILEDMVNWPSTENAVDDLIAGLSDDEVTANTSAALMNLANLIPSIPDQQGDLPLNNAGNLDIASLFEDAARIDDNLRKMLEDSNDRIPITIDLIEELKKLLNYVSGLLKPSEICSLFSFEASPKTKKLVLKAVQEIKAFRILGLIIKTTDDVATYFLKLGRYVNTAYCNTVVQDLSLITLLCEKKYKDEAYCNMLKSKGFSEEQCEEILKSSDEINKEKLETLEGILAYEEISDYFQDSFDNSYNACMDGALVDNDYMNRMTDRLLKTIFDSLSDRFNADVLGAKSLLIKEEFVPYGAGEDAPFRYPVLGRDYTQPWTPGNEVVGAEGTPLDGVVLFDENNTPQTGSFPKQDKVIRKVAPRLKTNIEKTDESNILKKGNISIDGASQKFKKFYSTVEIKSAGAKKDYTDLLIGYSDNWDLMDTLSSANAADNQEIFSLQTQKIQLQEEIALIQQKIDDLGAISFIDMPVLWELQDQMYPLQIDLSEAESAIEDLQTEIEDRMPELWQQLTIVNGAMQHNASIEDMISGDKKYAPLYASQDIRLVDLHIPKQQHIEQTNIPLDYAKFVVLKHGTYAFDKSQNGNNKVYNFEVSDLIKDKKTYDHLLSLYQEGQDLTGKNIGITFDSDPDVTLPEFTFARSISKSIANAFPGAAMGAAKQEYINNYKELEEHLVNIHQMHLVKKQGDIFRQCSKSRLFNIDEFTSLILGSQSDYLSKQLICNDSANPNLKKLRDGMLDYEGLKKLIKDYYKKNACEAISRSEADPDPFNDALRYGMALAYTRLILAEAMIRSLFFFSRFSVQDSLVDSSIFLTLMKTKMKENANLIDPSLYKQLQVTVMENLRRKVDEKLEVKILSNKVLYDDSKDITKRTFTSLQDKIFNLADLDELNKDMGVINADVVKIIAENNGFNYEVNSVFEIKSRLKSIFLDLAFKVLINDNTKSMVSRLDNILLDKVRRNKKAKNLLASQAIYDVPSQLLTFKNIDEGTHGFGDATIANFADGSSQLMYADNPSTFKPNLVNYFPWTNHNNKLSFHGISGLAVNGKYLGTWKVPPNSPNNIVMRLDEERSLFNTENTVDSKNINCDAYNEAYTSPSNKVLSSFYDAEGNLTHMGRLTKDGGFILQKYLKIKFNYSKDFLWTGEEDLFVTMYEAFQAALGVEFIHTDNATEFTISYKNFDIAILKSLEVFDNYINGVSGMPGLTLELADTAISYFLSSIKHGLRLVYVAPHNLWDTLDLDQNKIQNVVEDRSKNKISPISSSDLDQNGTFIDLIKNSIKHAEEKNHDSSMRNKGFLERAYEIKELIKSPNTSKLNQIQAIADDTGWPSLSIRDSFRIIKPFFIIPIEDAFIEKEMHDFKNLTFADIKQAFNVDPEWLDYSILDSEALSALDPLVTRHGIDSRDLVEDLFNLPSVRIFDDFVFPTSNLLNFAMLHHMYFPYDDKYNYDKMFLESRKIAAALLKEQNKPKNNWDESEPLSGAEGPEMESWNEAMQKALSFGNTSDPFIQWLGTVVPKFLLRYLVKQIDPGLAHFMNVQEEQGLPDKALLEMMWDPFGDRPTPIYPPGFPAFGDPSIHVGPLGFIYAALAFMPVEFPRAPEPELATDDTLGAPNVEIDLDGFSADPEDECKK